MELVIIIFILGMTALIVCNMRDEEREYENCYWEMESNGYACLGACSGLGEGCKYCPFNVMEVKDGFKNSKN